MHPRTVGRPPRRTPVCPRLAFHSNAVQERRPHRAFTLIELLVVIATIGILLGVAVPSLFSVYERARRTQAKNDLTQIVTAVNAFYTEYGRYPTDQTNDVVYGSTTIPVTISGVANFSNEVLFNELRAVGTPTLNTRLIVYMSPPDVKDPSHPKSGIGITGTGAPAPLGQYWDPWGVPYTVRIDADYNNSVANPYGAQTTGGAGADPIVLGVIAWSLGSDQKLGTNANNVYKDPTTGAQSDDVISWQ